MNLYYVNFLNFSIRHYRIKFINIKIHVEILNTQIIIFRINDIK